MIIAVLSIALVGFFVWAHHMFVTGLSDDTRIYFSSATMVIAIPTAIKMFTWLVSMSAVGLLTVELLVVVAFLICFMLGGFTGLVLANSSLDVLYHDTYYVVGHFHYVLSIAAALACLLVLRSFITASLLANGSQLLTRMTVLLALAGINWLFGTQHASGIDGQPRRMFSVSEAHHILAEIANLSLLILLAIPPMLSISLAKRCSSSIPSLADATE